jgi:hypothetical protein
MALRQIQMEVDEHKLAWHEGKYWYLRDEKPDKKGYLHLISIRDHSKGKLALLKDCRIVRGVELRRQLSALAYFREMGLCD